MYLAYAYMDNVIENNKFTTLLKQSNEFSKIYYMVKQKWTYYKESAINVYPYIFLLSSIRFYCIQSFWRRKKLHLDCTFLP